MFDDNKFLKGTSGELFVNNKRLAEINKVNVKMTGQFEDFAPCGDYCTHHVYVGYEYGIIRPTQKKPINSRVLFSPHKSQY